MKKIGILGAIMAMLLMVVGVNAITIVTEIHGQGTFDINTKMTHLDNDNFHGEGINDLNALQTVQIGSTSTWASDGADIDRYGEFSGGGELSTYSEYNSKAQWSSSHSEHTAWVESDDTGYLGQSTHWDSNFGGVKDVDQWKKQRTMSIGAASVYDMGFAGRDLRNNNWDFSFVAEGDGDTNLFVDNAYATVEHGSGQWYTPDDYHSDWNFDYTGDLIQNIYARGDRGLTFNENIDTVDKHIWGNTVIW